MKMTTMTAAEQPKGACPGAAGGGWGGKWEMAEGKMEREKGWSWWAGKHVSAHFTAQAFSLNKMLSGGEKATDKKQRQLMKGKGKARGGCGWLGGWVVVVGWKTHPEDGQTDEMTDSPRGACGESSLTEAES